MINYENWARLLAEALDGVTAGKYNQSAEDAQALLARYWAAVDGLPESIPLDEK